MEPGFERPRASRRSWNLVHASLNVETRGLLNIDENGPLLLTGTGTGSTTAIGGRGTVAAEPGNAACFSIMGVSGAGKRKEKERLQESLHYATPIKKWKMIDMRCRTM